MNIVFLFDSTYPYYTGGIETWIYNVCERMVDKHHITIFNVQNYRKDNAMGSFQNVSNKIEFISVKNLNHIKYIAPFVRSYIAEFNSNVTVYSMRKAFRQWVKPGQKYYVIALGTVFAAKTARLLKEEFPEIVYIASSRSLHPEVLGESYPGTKNIALKMEKKNLEKADEVWANGEDTQAALAKKGFHSVVIRNGLDTEKLEKSVPYDFVEMGLNQKRIIVTIGTVQKIKGYYELIEAVKILKEKYNFELHLVGVGKGNLDKFYKFAEANGVREQVHFVGEQRNVVSYAKGADVVACLSGGSGYGMAALESMLSETPVIAWDSPVYRQLIQEGVNGYLVTAWDARALADKIFYLWDEMVSNKEIGRKAKQSVQKFDWKYVIADIENALAKF